MTAALKRKPERLPPAVVSDPVRTRGRAAPARSSMIFGRAIVVMLKVIPPATIATANSSKRMTGRATGIALVALPDWPSRSPS